EADGWTLPWRGKRAAILPVRPPVPPARRRSSVHKRTGRQRQPVLPCSRSCAGAAPGRARPRGRASERALEVAHFLFGPLAAPAVLLLQLAGQVFAVALGNIEHVVGQVAPARLGLAFHLGPLAGNDVLVHRSRLFLGRERTARSPYDSNVRAGI